MSTRRTFLAGLLALGLAGFLTPGPALAQMQPQAAATFVQQLGDKAVAVIADPNASDAETAKVFAGLLNDNFDLTTIGRFVLGRYWNTATPEQQAQYTDLFRQMIVEVYTQRFNQYAGETFAVRGARAEGQRDAIVSSEVLRPNGPPVKVDWRVRDRNGSLQIIDVVVEGVSMSVTQRSEFASVIESNGGRIDALLNALRQRVAAAN